MWIHPPAGARRASDDRERAGDGDARDPSCQMWTPLCWFLVRKIFMKLNPWKTFFTSPVARETAGNFRRFCTEKYRTYAPTSLGGQAKEKRVFSEDFGVVGQFCLRRRLRRML